MTLNRNIRTALVWLLAGGGLVVGGCNTEETFGVSAPDPAQASYAGILDDVVTLRDGRFEGQPYVAGGASRPVVTLLPEPRAVADLDGDGVDELAVLLVAETGGSGTFVYLAVIPGRPAAGTAATATFVGDRVRVESLAIDGTEIHAELRDFGPGDPRCCPSLERHASWRLSGGEIVAQD